MSQKLCLLGILVVACLVSNAQYKVSGKVSGPGNQPLMGVSISVKNSYDGTTSGADGSFSLTITVAGKNTLLFTTQGYKDFEKDFITDSASLDFDIVMKEEITELKAVVVNAGVFEAGDRKRTTVLKSIDMVTTAGQQADITAALKTLPGTQQIGEQEGLFVRGGTGAETKVYIDGMMVTNPFFSSVPGISQRSRYSPLLFKGTIFSSGGYSAQYGQGLSSVLLLETIDLPSRSEMNLIISSAQLSIMTQRLNKTKNRSVGINVNYSNLRPYFNLVAQKYVYNKAPETLNAEFSFRQKGKTGFFKFYGYINHNVVEFARNSLDHPAAKENFSLDNRHIFSTATYTRKLGKNWQLYTGSSLSINKDVINLYTGLKDSLISSFYPRLSNNTFQVKTVITKNFSGLTKLNIGVEQQHITDRVVARDSIMKRSITDNFTSGFIETDVYFSARLAGKTGVRYEYSSLLGRGNFSPRASVAYKVNSNSQVAFAYGIYYQKPETNFLLRKSALDFTKASHYILNFQKLNNGRIFRAEAYFKKYENLVTLSNAPLAILNEGNGYAKGLEFFWRDKTSIKNLDYWVSYSFLDTKRKHLDYPSTVQPSFAAKHTLNIVAKRFFNALSTQFSATYNIASGRPYVNPARDVVAFMEDRTKPYQSLGLQANYLRNMGKLNAVFILNISNVLGTKQVFGYRYAADAGRQGAYLAEEITPMAKRFIFAGMYLSIGSDRRKEILD
ncbi:MAG: TonB-dependent receptor [Chitinophagaceae bacterium]